MEADDTFSNDAVPKSSIMRYRKRKAERMAQKSSVLRPKTIKPRGSKKRFVRNLGSTYIPKLLDLIGVRPLNATPPPSEQQKTDFTHNAVVCNILFIVSLITRFYRLAFPAKIGKLSDIRLLSFFSEIPL